MRRAAGAMTIALLTIGLLAGTMGVARGQTVPEPPAAPPPALPEPPEQADPAVDVVGPAVQGTLGPVCSSLAGALALGLIVAAAVGGEEAGELTPIYQQIQTAQVAACGVVPPPQTRTTCGPDGEISDGIAAAAEPAGEADAPVNPAEVAPKPRAVGGTVESAGAAESLATSNGAPPPGAADEAASALSCETVVVGGEFVPHQFDPAARAAAASGETPTGAAGGPGSAPTDVPVAQDAGGTDLATGAAAQDAGRSAELARSATAEAPIDGEVAAAPVPASSSGLGGKVAVLAVLGLLTGLSFIPTRTPVRANLRQ